MAEPFIVVAGATGDLGGRITDSLLARAARVRAIVRPDAKPEKVAALRSRGVDVFTASLDRTDRLTVACRGADCVVSALSGLSEVIVKKQGRLLDAAVAAGVERFLPSDFAIDYTKLPHGSNRNLDLRRAFQERIDSAPIRATSILSGMFMDLLAGQAPIVLGGPSRVLYWGDPDQPMDFTTRDDTARYTAAAALDPQTPRFLRIAGDSLSARGLAQAASLATGREFGLLRAGGLPTLAALIDVMRIIPSGPALYPPWQGMQYLHNMLSGQAKLAPLDNDRYPGQTWTTVRELLSRPLPA